METTVKINPMDVTVDIFQSNIRVGYDPTEMSDIYLMIGKQKINLRMSMYSSGDHTKDISGTVYSKDYQWQFVGITE